MNVTDHYTFTMSDQEWFAACSGDYNPIHLDAVAARRELTGDIVVHGVHVFLRTLEFYVGILAGRGISGIRFEHIKCSFRSPVYLHLQISFRIVSEQENTAKLEAVEGGKALLKCTLVWKEKRTTAMVISQSSMAWPTTPDQLLFEQLRTVQGNTPLWLNTEDVTRAFPWTQQLAGSAFLADLLAITRVVGMKAPGLRSMFSAFDLHHAPDNQCDKLFYEVREADDRISLFNIEVTGALLRGMVNAFFRPEPIGQMTYEKVKARVEPDAFRNQHALIIGGSRGIGEATAKIIAAGGGNLLLTYRVGQKEADAVCGEICNGGGSCRFIHYDTSAVEAGLNEIQKTGFTPTHIYYFATPRVVKASKSGFNQSLMEFYTGIYLYGFSALYDACIERWPGGLAFFYPSSISIDEKSRDLVEYACAKAAGEEFCFHMNAINRKHSILVKRLPVVATDLSRGLLDNEAAGAVETMLPLIQVMHRAAGKNQESS